MDDMWQTVVFMLLLRAASAAALGRVLVVGERSANKAHSSHGAPYDAKALRQTLSKLRKQRDWEAAHALLWEQLQDQPKIVDPVHCNMVLAALSEAPRGGEWERALVLLEHMPCAGLAPDAYTYSATISACARAGQSEHAVNTFKAMCTSDVPPNNVVFNTVLSACQRAKQHKTLLALFATMLIWGIAPDAWACAAAIGARDKGGDPQGALAMFGTLTRDQRSAHTYAAAMLAAKHANLPTKALLLYEEMLASGISPSPQTLGIALGTCAAPPNHFDGETFPNWRTALRLLSAAPKDVVDVQCFDAAIRACAASGCWQEALQLLAEIEKWGYQPSVHSFSGAISAQKQAGRWRTAIELLQQMKRAGVTLDSHALSATLGVCCAAGEWKVAVKLLQRMGGLGIDANCYHLAPVVRSCTYAGEWRLALSLVDHFEAQGLELNSEARDAALGACARGGQGQRALELLEGAKAADARMFHSAILALGQQREWRRAIQVLVKAQQAGAANAKSFSAAVGALERAERHEEARLLRRRCKEAGLVIAPLPPSQSVASPMSD